MKYLWYCYEKAPPPPLPPFWKSKGAMPPPCLHSPDPCAYYSIRTLFTRCFILCNCNERKLSAVSKTAVHSCKIIRQRVETEEWNTLSATSVQFTTAKTPGCANISSNSRWAEKVCGWHGGHPGLTVWNLLKLHKNCGCAWSTQAYFQFFYVAVIYTVQLLRGKNRYGACVSRYDQSAWTVKVRTKLEMMHILQAQVCVCISAHPGLPHQKTKRETRDAS